VDVVALYRIVHEPEAKLLTRSGQGATDSAENAPLTEALGLGADVKSEVQWVMLAELWANTMRHAGISRLRPACAGTSTAARWLATLAARVVRRGELQPQLLRRRTAARFARARSLHSVSGGERASHGA
jgi:hypothetical protein